MPESTRQVVVKMPEGLYSALAQLAAERGTNTSALLCEVARELVEKAARPPYCGCGAPSCDLCHP